MSKIKIAISGVGNCASSLVQGISYYSKNKNGDVGLLHRKIGKYDVLDIEVVSAFDVDARKVGKPLSEAIFAEPNNTIIFENKPNVNNVQVKMAPVLDGFPKHMLKYPKKMRFVLSNKKPVNVTKVLKETHPDFLINYLPVGSIKATKYFAQAALNAGVGFINAMPVFIGSNKTWVKRFERKNLLVLGDDIKSQVGATIVHRVLTNVFKERGAELDDTYQINFAGNTDFLNMLDKKRLRLKWKSKVDSVVSQYSGLKKIYAGPAEFIPYLADNKIAYINLSGHGFGNQPIEIELKLSVIDSVNSAGVMIDLIRLGKIAKDNKLSGCVEEISAFGFKHPIKQYKDVEAFNELKKWIERYV